MSTNTCSCVSNLTDCSSTSKYFVDPPNNNKYCVPSCTTSVVSTPNPTDTEIFRFTDGDQCKYECTLYTMDDRCVTACDASASDSAYAFLYVHTGSDIASWGDFYPVCVKDCFYTPKQFYFSDNGVLTCDAFPKAGYYLDQSTNQLSTTACTLYKSDDGRCTSTCSALNSNRNFDPWGTTGSSLLISAQNTHLERNDPECVPSCQGLVPPKLTYTDSNNDTSCTSSCPPAVRIPSGSHLSIQVDTSCKDTCTNPLKPVLELQSSSKVCITACRDSVETPENYFETTTASGYVPPNHRFCVSDCLSSNGVGHQYFKAVGT